MQKLHGEMKYYRLCGFLLEWLDFTCENSLNNSKCDRTFKIWPKLGLLDGIICCSLPFETDFVVEMHFKLLFR